MVGSILPVVYGARKQGRRATAHWIHLGGSVLAAGAFGACLSVVGHLLGVSPSAGAAVAALVASAYVLRSLDIFRTPAPERGKQVPAAWRVTLPPNVTAALYGAALGTGVFTHIWVLTMYPILTWVALGALPIGGAIVWSAYGLGRVLPVMVIERRTESAEQAFAISQALDRWSLLVPVLDGIVLSAATGLFAGIALS